MRVGLALSSIVHLGVLLVGYLAFASPRLFDPTPTETVAVDIVPADEVTKPEKKQPDPTTEPELPKIDLPKPEPAQSDATQPEPAKEQREQQAEKRSEPTERAAPSEAKSQATAKPEARPESKPDPKSEPDAKSQPAAPAPASPPVSRPRDPAPDPQMAATAAPPQPDPFAPDAVPQPVYFPMLKNLEGWATDYAFDAMAERSAALTAADIAAFREHLDKCWKPPAALARAQNLKAVLRIALNPDGAMAAEPILVGASASSQGPALVDTARRALDACQPFRFLPADKYSEWKILELNFTPRGLGG
jgi:outer membrane biosynthesis protein TonB